MHAPRLSTPAAPTSAGTYTSDLKCRTVCLAVPPKTKFLSNPFKGGSRAKGALFWSADDRLFVPRSTTSSISDGLCTNVDKGLLRAMSFKACL